jgi:hypothetical protein
MKKLTKNKKSIGTVMAKTCNTQKGLHWRDRLVQVAEAARTRVSGYSDERRSGLEKFSRSVIQGVKATQVCSR